MGRSAFVTIVLAIGFTTATYLGMHFVVLPRPFSVAADELTVSLKLRRNVVLAKYRAELEALYRAC